MAQVVLCLERAVEMGRIEEALRTLRFMMPRIELHCLTDADGSTVRFICESADTLTLSSAVLMLKQMLGHYGRVK